MSFPSLSFHLSAILSNKTRKIALYSQCSNKDSAVSWIEPFPPFLNHKCFDQKVSFLQAHFYIYSFFSSVKPLNVILKWKKWNNNPCQKSETFSRSVVFLKQQQQCAKLMNIRLEIVQYVCICLWLTLELLLSQPPNIPDRLLIIYPPLPAFPRRVHLSPLCFFSEPA